MKRWSWPAPTAARRPWPSSMASWTPFARNCSAKPELMSETDRESDLLRQRRANFEELVRLGVDPYPHRFERTDTIAELVAAHGNKRREELETAGIHTRTAGRVLAIRSFGKANFLVISDGRARIQVYVRQDAMPERDFAVF